MEVTTRRLQPADWPVFRDLRLRALADSPDAFGSQLAQARTTSDETWQRLCAGPGIIVVAQQDGVDVAMGGAVRRPGDDHLSIWGMWTALEARGHGHAARILTDLLVWCRGQDLPVLLDLTEGNASARALYVSHGFAPTGHRRRLREGSPLFAEAMRLQGI